MGKTVAALCLLLLLTHRAAADTPLYVGVLEGPQIESNNGDAISAHAHVRIAFRKDGANWKSMPTNFADLSALSEASHTYPDNLQWTIVFNGQTVGSIKSRAPNEWRLYADIGTRVLATRAFPIIRTGASDFIYGGETRAKIRPLLLISSANISAPSQWDPQGWKPSPLSTGERHLAIKALRGKVGTSERCDAPEEEPIHLVPYRDKAVVVVKSYRDNTGNVLFGVRLKDPKANCDFFDDAAFFDYWFVIDREQKIHYLDSQMTPIDAADLDNTGRSAWLFFTSRNEDNDGYEIFYDDFKKKAQFQWSYH